MVLKYSALDIYKVFISQNIEEIYFNSYFNNNNIILNLINNLGVDNGDGINRILELF